jgi:hypothetical protein
MSMGGVIAAPAVQAFIVILRDAHFREIMAPETVDFYCFLFAAGLTLASAGWMALRAKRAGSGCAPAASGVRARHQ